MINLLKDLKKKKKHIYLTTLCCDAKQLKPDAWSLFFLFKLQVQCLVQVLCCEYFQDGLNVCTSNETRVWCSSLSQRKVAKCS